MKIKVGMYVRTNNGLIAKLIKVNYKSQIYQFDSKIQWFYEYYRNDIDFEEYDEWLENYEPKFAKKLINLIEIGDIITYKYCAFERIYTCELDNLELFELIKRFIEEKSIEIKSIVTKEQFKAVEYRIGE